MKQESWEGSEGLRSVRRWEGLEERDHCLPYRQGEVLICYHASTCANPRIFLLGSCAKLVSFQ